MLLASLFAQAASFKAPHVDYAALAPEIVLCGVMVVVLIADLFLEERA